MKVAHVIGRRFLVVGSRWLLVALSIAGVGAATGATKAMAVPGAKDLGVRPAEKITPVQGWYNPNPPAVLGIRG